MKQIIAYIKTFIKETDIFLSLLCISASVYGVLMVYSATYSSVKEGAFISRDAKTMIMAVGVGIAAALIISLIDYEIFLRLWPLVGVVCVGLMVLTLLIGVGPESRSDVKTWIVLGNTGLYFQPSELVKIGFIITFSAHLDKVREEIGKLKNVLMLCIHGAIPVLLVAVSGDMGSALVFMCIFIVMMFCAGLPMRYFGLGAAAVAGAVPLAWKFVLKQLQKDRFLALIHPDEYEDIIYQQEQGLKAISSGGFWGRGFLQGTYTQRGLVPESENDMIFSVVGEEAGLFGCIIALLIFILIIARLVRNGNKARNSEGSLLCYGTAAMIGSQVLINIGMCLELLPVIGITLPFFSAGGSSNLCIHLGVGLMLSVYRYEQEHAAVNFRPGRLDLWSD